MSSGSGHLTHEPGQVASPSFIYKIRALKHIPLKAPSPADTPLML